MNDYIDMIFRDMFVKLYRFLINGNFSISTILDFIKDHLISCIIGVLIILFIKHIRK